MIAAGAAALVTACRTGTRGDPVPDIPYGQSTASGGDPSRPLADRTRIPPPGPGMPISAPGRAPIASAGDTTGGDATSTSPPTTTMRDTIAPRTIAPGDVDSTVESRGQASPPIVVTPAPTTGTATGAGTGTGTTTGDTVGGGTATGPRPTTGTATGTTGAGATGTPATPSTPGGPGR